MAVEDRDPGTGGDIGLECEAGDDDDGGPRRRDRIRRSKMTRR
jgi:hypothetical protein